MKALELLKADRDYCLAINNDKSIIAQYDEAIKELEDLQKDIQVVTDDDRILKEFVFTNCNECINKVDNHFTETCLSCKRYYGCYFEKKETK